MVAVASSDRVSLRGLVTSAQSQTRAALSSRALSTGVGLAQFSVDRNLQQGCVSVCMFVCVTNVSRLDDTNDGDACDE